MPERSPLERLYAHSLCAVLFSFAAALTDALPSLLSDQGRWVALGCALLLGMVHRAGQPRIYILSERSPDILVVGILTFYGASTLTSVAPDKSQLYFVVCTMQVLLFLFITRRLPTWIWRRLFNWLMILCAIVVVLSIAGYIRSDEQYITQGRLSGLSNANTTGLIAMLGCILDLVALLNITNASTMRARLLAVTYIVMLAMSIGVLLLTGSRGSLSGLLAGVATLLYVRISRVRASPVLVLGAIALAIASSLIDLPAATETTSVYSRGEIDDLFYSRRQVWAEAISLIEDAPWLGQGYGVHDSEGLFIDGSGYFGLAASAGIMATTLYIFFFFWIIGHVIAFLKRPELKSSALQTNQDLLAASFSCVVGLFVQGVGEPWMIGPGSFVHMIYWLCAGAAVAALSVLQHDK